MPAKRMPPGRPQTAICGVPAVFSAGINTGCSTARPPEDDTRGMRAHAPEIGVALRDDMMLEVVLRKPHSGTASEDVVGKPCCQWTYPLCSTSCSHRSLDCHAHDLPWAKAVGLDVRMVEPRGPLS